MWYVDIPNYGDSETWVNVKMFDTKDEAIEFAQDRYGADENGMVLLVTGSNDTDN
jgi:hypothetical protein